MCLLKISSLEGFLFPTFLSKKSGLLVKKKPVSYDVMNRSFIETLTKLRYDGSQYSLRSPKNVALSEVTRWSSVIMPEYYHKQSLESKLAVSRSIKLYQSAHSQTEILKQPWFSFVFMLLVEEKEIYDKSMQRS